MKRLARWAPGVRTAREYQRAWLPSDVLAGLVLTALLVPQGMAYAELAGLPPVTGLYTSILCLLAYAVFGPSRVLVLGPDSSLGPMIAASIVPLMAANGDPAEAVALASMLALMVGAILLLAGIARLGFVADLLSKPTQLGYLNGLALTILIGQLPKLFGFSVDATGLIEEFKAFVRGVADGKTVGAALAIGLLGIVIMLVLPRVSSRTPSILVTVVLSIVLANVFSLGDHGVKLIGELPQGFPPLTIPGVPASDLPLLIGGALGIALVAVADTISTASAFAGRRGESINGNQEVVGIATANLAAGLFQGFPVSTSASRTAVASQAGARTQLTGVVGAAAIIVMIVAFPGLLKDLPQPTLAAIVIVASISLADIPATVRLARRSRPEFALSLAAFLGVALFGVLAGIGVAVGLSVLNVFARAWWPDEAVLGRVPGLEGYHDVSTHPHAQLVPGLVLYRFSAPLFFANARSFREAVLELVDRMPDTRWIVLTAEPVTDIDTSAAEVLKGVRAELAAKGVDLVFAELKDPVRSKLERFELWDAADQPRMFPTIEAAVAAFKEAFPQGPATPAA